MIGLDLKKNMKVVNMHHNQTPQNFKLDTTY
jgi:hypothetical protein